MCAGLEPRLLTRGHTYYHTRPQCYDNKLGKHVALKMMKNDKSCYDAGLGELRVLSRIGREGVEDSKACLRLLSCFHYREHLTLITELLKESVRDPSHIPRSSPLVTTL